MTCVKGNACGSNKYSAALALADKSYCSAPSRKPGTSKCHGRNELDDSLMTIADRPDSAGTAKKPAVRVFVAVKVADDIAKQLSEMAGELRELPVRLVASADIHLTLFPPWNETAIPAAVAKLQNVAATAAAFTLTFRCLCYGPETKRPRLLWAECEPDEKLSALHGALLRAFGQAGHRTFIPHVTVARIRGDGRIVARKHPIGRPLAFSQRVETIELMQSPPPGGTGYRVLASLSLGGTSAAVSTQAGQAPPP